MQLTCVKGAKNFPSASPRVILRLRRNVKKFFRLRRRIFASYRRPVKINLASYRRAYVR